jgi:hypothetical protein
MVDLAMPIGKLLQSELLQNARFLTNSLGEQTDVVIPIDAWNSLIALVQASEPQSNGTDLAHHQNSEVESANDEQWLWKNPAALAAVQTGMRQAAQGETQSLGSFAQYANLNIDD